MRSLGFFESRRSSGWRAADSETALRSYAKEQRCPLDSLDANSLRRLMVSWYAEQTPADALDAANDGDGLLFEWGTYDWGGRTFRYGVTRQITTVEDDENEMWQLHVTLHYPADDDTAALGHGSHWCFTPDDVAQFEQAIIDCAATPYARAHHPERIEVGLDRG